MDIQNSANELKLQSEYLLSLKKEDVTFIIKSFIYELENQNNFKEEDLDKFNKVVLSNEPFNNLFFKYNKERLITKGVIFLEEKNDLTFLVSILYYFKLRLPMIITLSSGNQLKFYDIFIKLLMENKISTNFITKTNE